MEYELTALEQLVTVLISPAHLKSEKLTRLLFNQYALDCYHEIENIKKRFTLAVLKIADDNQIRIYIHQHQASLIRFADIIYLYLKSNELEKPEHISHAQYVITFYGEVYKDLAGLLLFLEQNFTKYFDLDARLTWLCHEHFMNEISNTLGQIKVALKKYAVSDDLIDITSEPLEKLQTTTSTITYRKRNYLKLLIFDMLELVVKSDKGVTNEQVCNELLGLNYNNTRFFSYLILQLAEHAKELNTSNELIMYFSSKMKSLNQLPVKPLLSYNKDLPNIREQLGSWINEEIYLHEKRQRLTVGIESKPDYLPSCPKIHTTLPVSQLSFALKLLIDSGIIINNNYTELTKIVAQNFKTDRIENISEDSLRNKYYNIERATADKMKDVVVNLLNLVRKY